MRRTPYWERARQDRELKHYDFGKKSNEVYILTVCMYKETKTASNKAYITFHTCSPHFLMLMT